MPQTSSFDQSKRSFLAFARFIQGISIIAFLFSLPFTLIGVGLAAATPLFVFLICNNAFIKKIKAGEPVKRDYSIPYYISAVFSGAGSALGFWIFYKLSFGIDTIEQPDRAWLYLAIFAPPIITGLIIFAMYRWNDISQRQIR